MSFLLNSAPAGDGSPGFPTRNTVTLPPIDAHKQQNNNLLSKRRTDSEESFARKLDNMLLLPGGANADHLQTPRVEKRSRFVEQCTHGWAYYKALGCVNMPTPCSDLKRTSNATFILQDYFYGRRPAKRRSKHRARQP